MARIEAVFDDSGLCRVISNGRQISEFATVYDPAFNRHYTAPFSDDGKVIYIGTWHRGLHCYSTSTGQLLWRKGPGKVRRILPLGHAVIVEMADRGLYRRNQSDGELTAVAKMSGIEFSARIAEDRIFAGPIRHKYLIFAVPKLEPVAEVDASQINPRECLSLRLLDVSAGNDTLTVRGWEEYPAGDHTARGARTFTREVTPVAFVSPGR